MQIITVRFFVVVWVWNNRSVAIWIVVTGPTILIVVVDGFVHAESSEETFFELRITVQKNSPVTFRLKGIVLG